MNIVYQKKTLKKDNIWFRMKNLALNKFWWLQSTIFKLNVLHCNFLCEIKP